MQAATIDRLWRYRCSEFRRSPDAFAEARSRAHQDRSRRHQLLRHAGALRRRQPVDSASACGRLGRRWPRREAWSPRSRLSRWEIRVIVAPGFPSDPAEWDITPENEAPSYFPTGTYGWGGYAQYMEVPARWVIRDETDLAPGGLATMPLVLVTAVHAVKTLGGVGPGSRVLVQAGASGSGSMAIQVAKALGADVITTVSTDKKAALARSIGADEVVRYRDADVSATVRGWAGRDGIDVVIDPVGGTTMADQSRVPEAAWHRRELRAERRR